MIAILWGLATGTLLGALGGGGGVLSIPVLIYALGLSPATAIPTSLAIVGTSAALGALPRLRHHVDWSVALLLIISGAATVYLGASLGQTLDPRILLLCFSGLLLIMSVQILVTARSFQQHKDTSVSRSRRLIGAIGIGLLVGFMTGLFGTGGGFLIVPALVLVLGMGMQQATGTALIVIVANSAVGLSAYWGTWSLTPESTLYGIAMIIASWVSSRFSLRLSERALKLCLALLLAGAGIFIGIQNLLLLVPET